VTRHEIQELAREIARQALQPTAPSAAPSSIPGVEQLPCPDWSPPPGGIAGLIDHTLLKPDASERDVARLCDEARRHEVAAACVHPNKVAIAERELRGSGVAVCTVIGFPHGANVTPVKLIESEQALKLGATELDMVVNIGALKEGRLDFVHNEIRSIADLAHQAGAQVKVILEMALLDDKAKVNGCVVAKLAGADFVKTSTGFGPSGADPADVALMHRVVGGEMGIKAAGGIRTYSRFRDMMRAGATRIGAGACLAILEEFRTSSDAR
jgi:deoxyribose-phosphate aldolase